MPLAEAAREAGHDVSFATTDPFHDKLAAAGFATHDVGITFREALLRLIGSHDGPFPTGPDGRPDPRAHVRLMTDILARPTAADLIPLLEASPPDLVVYEQGDIGAAVAAHVAGVPAAAHGLSPRQTGSALALIATADVTALWHEFGVFDPPVDVHTGAVYVDPIPASLEPGGLAADARRLAVRPIPWTEPGAPMPDLDRRGGRRLVYLTLGTAVAKADRLRPAIEALARIDADVVVALGLAAGEDLGAIPANVRVHDFVDQARVIPHAALVVHHGGSGTSLAALAHGVRQLVLPKGADQFANAELLAGVEAVRVLEPEAATPTAIAEAANAALAAPLPAAASELRREIAAMPHPRDVLPELLARTAAAPRPEGSLR